MRNNKNVFILLGAAFIIRLIMTWYSPANPHEDFSSYYEHAVRLVQGLGFSGTAGPTAFRAPGYPFFLASFFLFLGSSLYVAKFANVLLGTLAVWGVYLVSREVFSKEVGLVSAALVAFMPSLILYTPILASENLAIPFLLLSIWLMMIAWNRHQLWYFFLGGLNLAIVALARPGFLFFPGVLLIYMLLRRLQLALIFKYWTVFVLGLIIGLLPWTVRNYLVFREFIPISTNGGFNLAIGFNEFSTGEYMGNATVTALGKEYDWAAYRLKDSNLTEPELDRLLKANAIAYIKANPVRSFLLSFQKLRYFYQDDVSGVYHNIADPMRPTPAWLWRVFRWGAQLYYLLGLGTALCAVAFLRKLRTHPWALLIFLSILYWTGMHMVFFGGDRFHLPILPLIFSFSSFTMWELVKQQNWHTIFSK